MMKEKEFGILKSKKEINKVLKKAIYYSLLQELDKRFLEVI